MKFLTLSPLFCIAFLFSCKSPEVITNKEEKATTINKRETPFEIKQNKTAPDQSIGSPTPNSGASGARPKPQ